MRTLQIITLMMTVLFPRSMLQAATHYFHTNHLGTPQVVSDENQVVVWRGAYSQFGEVSTTVSDIEQNLRFPGQYYDKESDLHYNYFRDYDPSFGRYTQSDPIGLEGGLSTYGYGYQNLIRKIDPDGRQPICFVWPLGTVACAVAIVGTAASVKQCSDGVDDLQKGFDSAEQYRTERQQSIDCPLDPQCNANIAQQYADSARNAAQQTIHNAASAAQNLGTTVPGTSATYQSQQAW